MPLEILLRRLVTFLVDGQRESVSVLLIRYGMSEHYTIGYYDIALADKLINTASYRMRFFTDQMEINTHHSTENVIFFLCGTICWGVFCASYFLFIFLTSVYDSHANIKKKKKKLSEKKMKGKSTFHFHSFFGFSFFFFPSARTMYYKFVRECSFWRHKFSRFVHFSFSFFPLFLFIRFCSSFVPPFPGYLRFCYLFSQYFFFFILFLFFSVVFKFGNKKASFS